MKGDLVISHTSLGAVVRENHFKAVNDTARHAAGDAVLAAFGTRLTAWAGPRVAAGRLGGDEFAVVLRLPADRRQQRLNQLVRMLHTPVTLDDGRTLDVAASVGAATPDVVGTRDLTALQRTADAALYDGKHSGRAHLATTAHTSLPSVNGRRSGRPGTAHGGERHEHRSPSAGGRLDPRHQHQAAQGGLHSARRQADREPAPPVALARLDAPAHQPADRPSRPAPAAGRPHDPGQRAAHRRRYRCRPADRLPPGPGQRAALRAVVGARPVAPRARRRPGAPPADPRPRTPRALEAHRGPGRPSPPAAPRPTPVTCRSRPGPTA
ncbi:diguanylate cyclase, partial [Streptomyces sp. McG6]|nr:diguanylate cyclase [Streptomyces sp. McG6]